MSDAVRNVRWTVHEDDERVCLQIELGQDYAVTLTCWKDGAEQPSVALWHGSGERAFNRSDLGPVSPDSFRAWLEEVPGRD